MMEDAQTRLDGNAAAGLLREVFAEDVTSARGACKSCGQVGRIGAAHVYMANLAPGAVIRCNSCESVLVVLVEVGGRVRLGMSGLEWLEIGEG
ncbi:MAG TPA: DUF6510 family protein [Candidatus Dormibacteraeota bacterium]|jgi:hypothetical protein|nr:DUF6510 family protein [Candidatus Dormibacteraeota bacterium]